jgi:hypothetical protein
MSIHKKLLEFQKLGISVVKSSKNPHFKSNYANLNEVLEKVKQPLNKLGVVILFEPQSEGLKTTLHDVESNTEISSFMKYIDCGNAQKLLACNTYFRRGSLVSLLGLEDEDDDGNKASAPNKKEPIEDNTTEFLDFQIQVDNCSSREELGELYNKEKSKIEKYAYLKAMFIKRGTEFKK